MEDDLTSIKGMIPFPCGCRNSEAVVYKGATGKISVRCKTCGRPALFDQDRMTAIVIQPIKGASKKFHTSGISPSRLGP